jgi:hypothetical protein
MIKTFLKTLLKEIGSILGQWEKFREQLWFWENWIHTCLPNKFGPFQKVYINWILHRLKLMPSNYGWGNF